MRGWAAFRAWGRRSEVGLVLLAALVGGVSGLLASLMSGATHWLHVALFGPGAEHGLSALRHAPPWLLLLVPTAGGLLLAALNRGIARWWPLAPIVSIEVYALHGCRITLCEGCVV